MPLDLSHLRRLRQLPTEITPDHYMYHKVREAIQERRIPFLELENLTKEEEEEWDSFSEPLTEGSTIM